MEDSSLIMRLKNKEISAFEEAVHTYKNYVGSIIISRINGICSKEDFEELVSDVFFALWQQCDRIDPNKGTLKAYLGYIARNKAIDKSRCKSFVSCELDDAINLSNNNTPESDYLSNETLETIQAGLAKIGKTEQRIFNLFYYEGLKVTEISKSMNMNESTVKTKLARTRKKLRTMLEEMR